MATKKHETGFEPATLALARRYSTTEPLVHIRDVPLKTAHNYQISYSFASILWSSRELRSLDVVIFSAVISGTPFPQCISA